MLQAVVAGGDVAVAGCPEVQARRAQGMALDAAAGVVAGGPGKDLSPTMQLIQ
jgi:hypothetical protein